MTSNRLFCLTTLVLGLNLSIGVSTPALAGPGHDHGDAPAAPSANGPQRQPDGSVFLPKPAQRQLGVRTMVTEEAELPRSVELNGKVLMDPNAGGKVQPLNAGRIEPGPRGLPNAGQAVRKGEVLAYVVPSAAPIERSNQAAQLAELRAAKSLADKRVARLKELADTVPRKDIEAAESEAQSLAERIAAVGTGLASREALVAPVSGVIASAHVVAGQVVDARELVFEIVDPARLRVEALAFDAALAGNVGSASLAVGNQRVPLAFIGAARSLREQALPLVFRAQGNALNLLEDGEAAARFLAAGPGRAVAVEGRHAERPMTLVAVPHLADPSRIDVRGRLELFEYLHPEAIETEPTLPNEIGMHRVAFSVDNKLQDDGSKVGVDLKFNNIEDFEPDNIVQQVEPLRKLVEARQKLSDLRSKMDGNEKLENLLESVISDAAKQKELSDALGLEAKKEE